MTHRKPVSVQNWLFRVILCSIAIGQVSPVFAQAINFETQIASILVANCLECHQGAEPEGGLDLTNLKRIQQGGDSGTAIVAGKLSESLLWKRVDSDEMPPKHPLSHLEKAALKKWIEDGPQWGSRSLDIFSVTTERRAGRDWWSLQPIEEPSPPVVSSSWIRNEIDAFVQQRLITAGLQPSSEADPRTLIRRLFFDLVGLPPTPEQVDAFVRDPSEAAYQELVDDLLRSQHYGERWGRHWLDVVRFGESNGFERNLQRENAWHYRDWVIRALNDDMPYDQFVRMQLVGDQLDEGLDGAAATGFWVAGVHNTTVGGSDRMKQLARQDEIEDVLATLGQAFVGLTFHCARCHDHKFDPISQTEYYQLASTISGLGFGERVVTIAEERAKLSKIDRQIVELRSKLATIEIAARERVISSRGQSDVPKEEPSALARWEFESDFNDSLGRLHGKPHGNAHLENGALVLDGTSFLQTVPIEKNLAAKTLEAWVQLDDLNQRGGAAISIETRDGVTFDAIVFGERNPRHWMAGSNGFVRTDSLDGVEETAATQRPVHVALVYQADGTIIGYRDGQAYGRSIRKSTIQTYHDGETEILFGLRHKPAGGNRYLKGRIHRAALYDRALSPEEIAASAGYQGYVSESQMIAALDDAKRKVRVELKMRIENLTKARQRQIQKANRRIYTLKAGSGKITKVLLRGDPDHVGEVVSPASTAAIGGLSGDFGLAPDAAETERRRKLADWITNENNPLFGRVVVNRVWHYHFGTGIVDTPNDFGFNGGRPSHPQLLDYLASQFQKNGSRLKWLHRLIVLSNTYRQSVHGLSTASWRESSDQDAENRLLWRANPRRLEAESLRDAILHVSGQLNHQLGGPSFKDVSVKLNNGTTYYEPIAVDGPEFFRRTVYRFNPRGGRSALLDTFDCPDPSATAPRRSVTTTPLQSLSLMNNPLVARMADYFAKRVRDEVGDDITQQVTRAWRLAIARNPTETERTISEQLVREHGLAALCRGLFNINEFVVIQ